MRTAVLLLAAFASFGVLAAPAQDAASPKKVTTVDPANPDCATLARRSLHDHGIERGYGPMPIKACDPKAAAQKSVDASQGTGAAIPRHDHGKFHKNQ